MAFHTISVMARARGVTTVIATSTYLKEAVVPADDVTRTPVPAAITTPSRVEAGIGTLEFTDGYPTRETTAKLRDSSGLLARCRGVHELDPGGVDLRRSGGIPGRRDKGRRRVDLLGVDGLQVTVLDRERRHGLLPRLPRPVRRSAGAGDPHGQPGHRRRHVVRLDHRLRSARRGSRPRRHLPAAPPGLRRTGARGRPLRPSLGHQPCASARPGVHRPEREQRPRPDRGPDQGAAEDLPLLPRRPGQQHRRLPDRAWSARPTRGASEPSLRGGDRAGDEHGPAQ